MPDPHQISRKEFIRLSSLTAAMTALTACALRDIPVAVSTSPQLNTVTPTTTQPETKIEQTRNPALETTITPVPQLNDSPDLVLHGIRRLFFGFTPAQLEHARSIGLEALIEEQLDYTSIDDSAAERPLQGLEIYDKSVQELLEVERRGLIVGSFVLSTLVRQVRSPRQLFEMMVDFWTNHFNIFLIDGFTRVLKIFDDRDVARAHALGTFSELLQASAHSPAMLVYLDQAFSTKNGPNENYPRELLELHTLGVNGGYTQEDVRGVARTLTGWSVAGPRGLLNSDTDIGSFIYRPFIHDNSAATVMGYEIPAGSGKKGGEKLLDFLASNPSTARHISEKLARRFVADEPPRTIVARLADTFQSSGGDIKSLIRTLVKSPEFAASAGAKFKRPLEYVVSLMIATQAQITPGNGALQALFQRLRTLGQVPHFWPAPDGYPDVKDWWITTNGMLQRWNLSFELTSGQIPGVRIPLARLSNGADNPKDLVEGLSRRFLGYSLSGEAQQILVDYAAEGSLQEQIPDVAALILASPYFQVR